MIGSRLSDPRKIIEKELGPWLDELEGDEAFPRDRLQEMREVAATIRLSDLQEKIASCMARLFRKPVNGGNPFLFAFAAPKPHELTIKYGSMNIDTAATDGRKYFWNPIFLATMSPDEVATVMQHEGYHVVFSHPRRGKFKMPNVWNIAVDYAVNSCILHDQEKTQRKGTLFGGNIGTPLLYKDLLAYIDGAQELPKGVFCYADKSVYGRSPDAIYDEIIDHWNKSPRKCPVCGGLTMKLSKGQDQGQNQGKGKGQNQDQDQGQNQGKGQNQDQGQDQDHGCGCGHKCPGCGSPFDRLGSMDCHIDSAVSRQEIEADLMRASEQATQMRGTTPSEIEGMLSELKKPALTFTDIVRSALLRKVQDVGNNNDWKRIRRRFLNTAPKQYLPKQYIYKPRWLAALDTSGSMTQSDMEYGISQLQVLGNNTDGVVVPMDVTAKWKDAVKIDNATASELIKKVKLTGRGGTDFNDFFAGYRKILGSEYDVIVVLTDGYCGTVDLKYKPPQHTSVVWVLTQNNKDFVPPFGRIAHLRVDRT
jgi:predicted metal-dependent peptidase